MDKKRDSKRGKRVVRKKEDFGTDNTEEKIRTMKLKEKKVRTMKVIKTKVKEKK